MQKEEEETKKAKETEIELNPKICCDLEEMQILIYIFIRQCISSSALSELNSSTFHRKLEILI